MTYMHTTTKLLPESFFLIVRQGMGQGKEGMTKQMERHHGTAGNDYGSPMT